MDWCELSTWKQKYVVISFLAIVRPASVQFAMPMFPMPPGMMPVNVPAYAQPKKSSTSVTSQLESSGNMAFAIPVPMPMPMQIAMPALPQPSFCASKPRPPGCPPCPPCLCFPSCTPSFFTYCSPCHQKCRCKNGMEPPVPLPPIPPLPAHGQAFGLPMPMPSPAIMVPIPPFPNRQMDWNDRDRSCSKNEESSEESSDESSGDNSSTNCSGDRERNERGKSRHRRRRIRRKRRMNFGRRNMASDDKIIKPVLSFINGRGHTKFKHVLSTDDMRTLMRDSPEQHEITSDIIQNVRLTASNDAHNRPQIVLQSENVGGSNRTTAVQQKRQGVLKHGRKELVFKPPPDKTITNLSVSFQVA